MVAPTVSAEVIPTGGAVLLQLPDYLIPASGITTMLLSRAVSGTTGLSAWSTVYSGAPVPTYIDAGDGLPAPLSSGCQYVWSVQDNTGGTTQVGPLAPISSVASVPDALTQLFIRLLQGGVNCLSLPPGIAPSQVTTEMPQGGWAALPFIVVNLDLIQQTEVQIGEDVPNPGPDQDWTLWVNARRVWRINVFSTDAGERDYYRDSLLMMFRVLKAYAFAPIGLNVAHSFQAASATDADEWKGRVPGFYQSEMMYELNGLFNTAVVTSYGTIGSLSVTVSVSGSTGAASTDTYEIPPSA